MVKVLVGGDYCPSGRVAELVESEKFEDIFREIIPITKSANYSVLNLESPIVIGKGEPILKYGPHLRASTKVVKSIMFAGFDMVTLANNHFYDYGDSGVEDTLNTCTKYDLATVGGGKNIDDSQKVTYKELDGKRFAFINFCEHEFSIATESKGGSNPLNPIANYYQIQESRKKSDYIIVIVHGGHEHYQFPSPRMKEAYRFFVDAGADAVINHHQHCYSGYEVYNGRPIFYGLGNLSFDWEGKRSSIWNEGFLTELNFDVGVVSFTLYPYIQGNDDAGIVMMDEGRRLQFEENIQRLNSIINDDALLKKATDDYYLKEGRKLYSIFEPYTNRYLRGLYRRNLLPSFISKKKLLAITNIVECEAHKDQLINYLKTLRH